MYGHIHIDTDTYGHTQAHRHTWNHRVVQSHSPACTQTHGTYRDKSTEVPKHSKRHRCIQAHTHVGALRRTPALRGCWASFSPSSLSGRRHPGPASVSQGVRAASRPPRHRPLLWACSCWFRGFLFLGFCRKPRRYDRVIEFCTNLASLNS